MVSSKQFVGHLNSMLGLELLHESSNYGTIRSGHASSSASVVITYSPSAPARIIGRSLPDLAG
jgi:hypothetical protein